ncbi:MAG: DUF998 domain-containing protein [Chloroflexi bacterium]|nr:DUF998 domain-containing protein [Chloroflexota bacterium]
MQPDGAWPVTNSFATVAGSTSGTRALLACGIAAPAILAVFVLAAEFLRHRYSRKTQGVSELGAQGSRNASVFGAGLVAFGVLLILFATGLHGFTGDRPFASAIRVLLAYAGAAIALSGVFRVDPQIPGNHSMNAQGFMHAFFAFTAAGAFALTGVFFSRLAHSDPDWSGFETISLWAAAFQVVLGLAYWLRYCHAFKGWVQRAEWGICMLWLEAVSVRAVQLYWAA